MSTSTDLTVDSDETLGEEALTRAQELFERDPVIVRDVLLEAEDRIRRKEKLREREQHRIGRQHDFDRRERGVWAEPYVLPDGSRPVTAVDEEGVLRGVFLMIDPDQGTAIKRDLEQLLDGAADRFEVAQMYPPWARREAPEVANGDGEEVERAGHG